MSFYKKYETLNDIPEPFRRTRQGAQPPFFAPPEPVVTEAALHSENETESGQDKKIEHQPEPAYQEQSKKIHKGNQDMVFMLLMFMLLTE